MPTFPALDEGPPPRPPRKAVVRVAAVVAVLAAVAALLGFRPWRLAGAGGPGSPAAAQHPDLLGASGRVLVPDFRSGRLGYTALDGSGFQALRGTSVPGADASGSPDGTALASFGTLVRLSGKDAVLSRVLPPASQGSLSTTSYPWADHGHRLVLMTMGGGHADPSTVDLHGHHEHSLGGGAADAVGDPTRDGALVMVAGRHSVNIGQYAEMPTVRLELRAPVHAHVVAGTIGLATKAGLPTGLHGGKHHTTRYAVTASLSPDGQQIAVGLDQLSSAPSAAHGLVVVSRGGTPLFSMSSSTQAWASWSHTGDLLAFPGQDGSHVSVLHVDDPRAAPEDIPVSRAQIDSCLWSPEDTYLLCDDHRAGRRYVLRPSDGHVAGPFRLQAEDRFALAWQSGKAA